MKKLYFSAAALVLAFTSCTTNEDSTSSSSFFPLLPTSAWVYDVNLDAQSVGRDSLYVSGETTINGNVYQKLNTKEIPAGFYTTILNNNSLRKSGDQLLLSGTTGLAFSDFLPVNIELSDFVIFKENAAANAELDAVSGTINQELQGISLKIDYVLNSIFKETLNSFTVPGKENYMNVKVVKLIANLTVSTVYLLPVFNTPITIPVLNSQDVIISTHYYAEGIGMIYSKTAINYQLQDLPQNDIELPFPQEGSSTIEEFLD
jgi:hypothetical protein